ncbi:MAG: endonuclease domain-containing protein [Alphaproteobacteria bacterium]|nr:endonuclease domain-containing protein [Alphaproteobacteria bacterium]
MINRSNTIEKRRDLRQKLTPAEALFWNQVKNSQLDGRKFRRQQSVGPYIVDFYRPGESLAVELDGGVHNQLIALIHDGKRDQYIESCGIKVLRFNNKIIFSNIDGVLDEIRQSFGWK